MKCYNTQYRHDYGTEEILSISMKTADEIFILK